MGNNMGALRLAIGGLALLLGGCATTAKVDSGGWITIPSQPLEAALLEWSVLTGYQLIVPDETTTNRVSRPIRGADATDAIRQLLAGTGLSYVMVNESTVAICCAD